MHYTNVLIDLILPPVVNSVYDGDFVNNLCHGNGSFTWPSGTIYVGGWENGKIRTGSLRLPGGPEYSPAIFSGGDKTLNGYPIQQVKLHINGELVKQCSFSYGGLID